MEVVQKMKTKIEEPILIRNLTQMHEYPSLFNQGHWDIVIGTMKMIFNKFPEIDKYMNTHEMDENDQKHFNHKLEDLMLLSKGAIK